MFPMTSATEIQKPMGRGPRRELDDEVDDEGGAADGE